jgi:predicted lipid-binding transport protein (Tim44 family)
MLAAAYIEWRGALEHGQWTVWSAASVANAEAALALTKFKNRALGVLGGVAAGLLLGPHLPSWPAVFGLSMVCIFLTITVIRSYVFSYGARCFFVTLAAFGASHGSTTANDRVINVLVGGAIGLAVTALWLGVTRRADPT